MKSSIFITSILTLFGCVSAYPSTLLKGLDLTNLTAAEHEHIKRELDNEKAKASSFGFDADAQYIKTTGTHKFVPPNFENGDQRGPCPGLNALANHGYLPHNGVGTITQFLTATTKVFGLGADISTILSVYGAVSAGNGVKWSIGGKSFKVPAPLPILHGQPGGISFSHNIYEGDGSPTRGDLYQYGDGYKLVMSQFEALFNKQPDAATADYGHTGDVELLQNFRAERLAQCKAENPYFFAAPVSFLVGGAGAYQFISLFANHSAEHPEGRLDQETLKSFFAITGSGPGNFVYQEGWEKIPSNWYRRPIGYEYNQALFSLDYISGILQHPEFVSFGGNTGTVNSFAGINLGDLTGGLYHLQDLLLHDKAWCFIHEAMLAVIPDSLAPILRTLLGAVFAPLGCPVLAAHWDADVFDIFPGSKI